MAKNNIHVTPRDDGWAITKEGNKRASFKYRTKSEATKKAREIAINENSELLVHNKDGKISWRNTYGKDPFPPKG